MRKALLILAILCAAIPAFGQGTQVVLPSSEVRTTRGPVVPGATITVCPSTASGTPCSPFATVYFDQAMQVPELQPLTADGNGNFLAYAPAGTYIISVTGQGLPGINFTVVLPCSPGSTNSACGAGAGTQAFLYTQTVPATTWVITHNLNTPKVTFDCYDTNNQYMVPDTSTITSLNVLTVTFATAQAGSCVVAGAGTLAPSNAFSFLTVTGGGSLSGNFGSPNFIRIGSMVFADQQAGADCGAKINNASALLAGPGKILVNQNCGPIATALNITLSYQTIEFIQGGTYTYSVPLSIPGIGSGITAQPCPESNFTITGDNCAVLLEQANGSNLTNAITLSGPQSFVHGITLDGNKANNSSVATVGILITGNRAEVTDSDVQHFHGDGIQINGSPAPPGSSGCDGVTYCIAEGANLNHVQSGGNDGNGLTVLNQTDVFAHFSKFEINGGWGTKVTNGTLLADKFCDWGGNALGGVDGITTSANFNVWTGLILIGDTFGNNGGPAVFQSGWNGAAVANGVTQIQDNSIAGGTSASAIDLVHLEDVTLTSVQNNTVNCQNSGANCNYGINVVLNHGSNVFNTITGNQIYGTFNTNPLNFLSYNYYEGNGTNGGAHPVATPSLLAILTVSNCNPGSSASPAACGSAPSGTVVVPTTTTAYTVDTTAVTANSRITILPITDASGLTGSPTCNAPPTPFVAYESGRTAGVSFSFTLPSTTGASCWTYSILN